MQMIKLIIFDWDDVFTAGSKEGYFACYREALNAVGIILSEEEFRKRILQRWGQSPRREMENVLCEHPHHIEEALKVYNKALFGDTFFHKIRLMHGSNELLLRLKEKYILALATGIHPENLKRMIETYAVPEVFAEIIFSSELPDPSYAKPDKFMIEEILKRGKVDVGYAMMVGDAANDMLMAKNAGVMPVAVLSGHLNRKEAEELGVKYILEDVTEVEKVLEILNQREDAG